MMIRLDETMEDVKVSTNYKLNTKLVFILMELNHIVNNKLDKFADQRITCIQKIQSNPMAISPELTNEYASITAEEVMFSNQTDIDSTTD